MSDCPKNQVTITQGATKTFFINLTVSEDGQPPKAFVLDTPPTSIEVRLPAKDNTVLRLPLGPKVIVDDAAGGRLKIVMPAVDSATLNPTEDLQDIEVEVVQDIPDPATTKYFMLKEVLLVKAQLFPVIP